jgi:hypothetical protein
MMVGDKSAKNWRQRRIPADRDIQALGLPFLLNGVVYPSKTKALTAFNAAAKRK